MSPARLELDGSLGEGGGQILRSSLTLSLLTGTPFRLRRIRANRPKPGLKAQHLMSVQAAAAIGQATVTGASLNSTDLTFEPGMVQAGTYHFPIRTAGATGLVLQTIALPLALQREASEVVIEGGTHNPASPCYHFLDLTWRPYLAALGMRIDLDLRQPGFYPRGGGSIRAVIHPVAHLLGFQGMDPQPLASAKILSAVASLNGSIARRQSERAEQRLKHSSLQLDIWQESRDNGPGTVCGILLPTTPAPTFFFGLGERGKPAERVADEAAEQVLAYLAVAPGGVDEHSADQLLVPLAFAQEASRFRVARVSSHLLTNATVLRRFLSRGITIEGNEGEPGVVALDPPAQ